MGSLFHNLGMAVGRVVRKANWIAQELTGTDDQVIEAEYRYGRDLARAIVEEQAGGRSLPDSDLLNAVGQRLTTCLTNRKRRITFSLLPGPGINAYAVPGGFIFVTEPLLVLLSKQEDCIAFVLAHEIGHVVCGHARDRLLSNAMLSTLSLATPASGQWNGLFRRVAKDFVSSAYSQEHELEADGWALRLLQKAGFDPAAGTVVLQCLAKLHEEDPILSEYFSSHPPIVRRIAEMRRLLPGNARPRTEL
jgi:predicted Zn-dependent protease